MKVIQKTHTMYETLAMLIRLKPEVKKRYELEAKNNGYKYIEKPPMFYRPAEEISNINEFLKWWDDYTKIGGFKWKENNEYDFIVVNIKKNYKEVELIKP